MIWSAVVVLFFTVVYSYKSTWFTQKGLDWIDVLYFSVVTFTTLGFGDVTPQIGNHTAEIWVMIQVVIGYVMLGGLISILANKLARRA
ncbi:MAG: ion channel [Thermodesulfobacteriota bacterium]